MGVGEGEIGLVCPAPEPNFNKVGSLGLCLDRVSLMDPWQSGAWDVRINYVIKFTAEMPFLSRQKPFNIHYHISESDPRNYEAAKAHAKPIQKILKLGYAMCGSKVSPLINGI